MCYTTKTITETLNYCYHLRPLFIDKIEESQHLHQAFKTHSLLQQQTHKQASLMQYLFASLFQLERGLFVPHFHQENSTMAKLVSVFLLAILTMYMVATTVLAANTQYYLDVVCPFYYIFSKILCSQICPDKIVCYFRKGMDQGA